MQKIELTKGKFAIVDDDDFERLNSISWNYNTDGYAASKIGLMHRIILNAPKGSYVDHKNHDTLDNRKENIWICTASDNSTNNRKRYPHLKNPHIIPTQVRIGGELLERLLEIQNTIGVKVSMASLVECYLKKGIEVYKRELEKQKSK